MNAAPIPADRLAAAILAGDESPAAAFRRPDAFDALNRGANGPLPFLGTSVKIDAGLAAKVLTRVLYMMPADASGREACAGRSAGCTAACLAEGTGKMSMKGPRRARRRRHASFYADRPRFLATLAAEIATLEREASRKGYRPAVRLNGTTDLPWERMSVVIPGRGTFPNLMEAFPAVTFYDYTKVPLAKRGKRGVIPANYHLTFSYSERPDAADHAAPYLAAGLSVAVVFAAAKGKLPTTWRGIPVIDGDKTDARFMDEPGRYVGLSAKGRAKRDESGFVQSPTA